MESMGSFKRRDGMELFWEHGKLLWDIESFECMGDRYVRADAVIGTSVKTSYGKAKVPDEAPEAADWLHVSPGHNGAFKEAKISDFQTVGRGMFTQILVFL